MIRNAKGFRSSIKGLGTHKRISPADLAHDVVQLRDGNEDAKERIIMGHIGLAGSVAARYAYVIHRDPDELLAVAMLGLVEAVDRMSKGACDHNNYGGYIHKCVNGRVSNFLDADFIVLPPNGKNSYERLKKEGLGFNPSMFIALTETFPAGSVGRILEELLDSKNFTQREKDILRLSYEGYSDREISVILDLGRAKVQRIRQGLKELVKQWLKK